MKAETLANILLQNPTAEVSIFDGDILVDLNTITPRDIGDNNLFDKNDGNGIFKIRGENIKYNKFNKNIILLSHQKDYKYDH